ncbi:hypothetical protein D7V86_01360 [bacterium D16-51]|nr:hypothetical protein D7V96_03960 [bacterium D16-59]RKI62875.1 hypothetical protein D7V86_01360 [bacterium D16-51]
MPMIQKKAGASLQHATHSPKIVAGNQPLNIASQTAGAYLDIDDKIFCLAQEEQTIFSTQRTKTKRGRRLQPK